MATVEEKDNRRATSEAMRDELLPFLRKAVEGTLDEKARPEVIEKLHTRVEVLVQEGLERLKEEIKDEIRRELTRLVKEQQRIEKKKAKKPKRVEEETFLRFSLNFRIQHVVLFMSCLILILTGLPLKFHDTGWAAFMFRVLGGIEGSGLLHRIGATGLIGVGLYHLVYLAFFREGRQNFVAWLPRGKDFQDLFIQVKYYLGLSNQKARFGRFSYIEKFDYWAVYWGMVIMIGSGLLLWFEEISLRFVPKFVIDIAKEAHSDEALLATLAIIIWHFYNVHFNPDKFPMNWAWLTGRISKKEMLEEHPLEYEKMLTEMLERKGHPLEVSEGPPDPEDPGRAGPEPHHSPDENTEREHP